MFKMYKPTFEFVGKLEIIEETTRKDGTIQKGSINDNGKGFKSFTVKGNVKNQGEFKFSVNSFNNPIVFKLNEVDSKGNNKTYEYSGGELKYEVEDILDIYKSRYTVKDGEKESIYYHSKEFVNLLEKNISKIKKNKDILYKLKGTVERTVYNNKIIEKYTFNHFEILGKSKDIEEKLTITEVIGLKKEEQRNIGKELIFYKTLSIRTKDKGYTNLFIKSDETLKFSTDFLNNGVFKSLSLDEIPILESYKNDLSLFNLSKCKVTYHPTVSKSNVEKVEISVDELPQQYKSTYNLLIEKGLVAQAKIFLNNMGSAIRVSEGGGVKNLYINEFELSSDSWLLIVEELLKEDFLVTDIKNVTRATKKENVGKLLLSSLLVKDMYQNETETKDDFTDWGEETNSFEDDLKEDNSILSEDKEQGKEEMENEIEDTEYIDENDIEENDIEDEDFLSMFP